MQRSPRHQEPPILLLVELAAERAEGAISELSTAHTGALVQNLRDAAGVCASLLHRGPVKADPKAVLVALVAMADGGIPTLLCWEAPPPNEAWCHRGLVSAWLFDELGLIVPELGHESAGYGWQHPKLHPTLMRAAA